MECLHPALDVKPVQTHEKEIVIVRVVWKGLMLSRRRVRRSLFLEAFRCTVQASYHFHGKSDVLDFIGSVIQPHLLCIAADCGIIVNVEVKVMTREKVFGPDSNGWGRVGL